MAAPTGNKFWMLRSKHGRDKLFSTPELLWEAACEYFQWCDENPWLSKKAIQKTVPVRRKKGKKVETVNEQQVQQEVSPTSRPYSLTGFCIYVGASSQDIRLNAAFVINDDSSPYSIDCVGETMIG